MSLESLQTDFAAAMFDLDRASALMPSLLHRDARSIERIALYRGNLLAAWQKALGGAFPVVRAIVGEEFFDALARVYGHAHPATGGDLNQFGIRFAAFVADFEHTQSLPYLSDVASLEWAAHRAHYAADPEPLSRARIASLQPQELLTSRFAVHDACAWLSSAYPIATIWFAHQSDTTCSLPESLHRSEIALVVRPQWRVEVVASSVGEIAALDVLRSGEPLEAAIEAALDVDATFDFARALVRWLDLGVLSRGKV